jgi:hypothetical protein
MGTNYYAVPPPRGLAGRRPVLLHLAGLLMTGSAWAKALDVMLGELPDPGPAGWCGTCHNLTTSHRHDCTKKQPGEHPDARKAPL